MIEIQEVGVDHLVPVEETGTQWEQTKEIPVKHWTPNPGSSPEEVLHYQYKCGRFAVCISGQTLAEAESGMRKHLPLDIEIGAAEGTTPTRERAAMIEELLHYFQRKPQDSI